MNLSSMNNLSELVTSACEKYASKPAYNCIGQTLSFAEVHDKSNAFAAWLQHHSGLSAGDRVVIQLPNLIQFPVALYGIVKAGLVVVNTNPLYTAREMEHQFKDSGAKAIVIVEDLLPKLDAVIDQTHIQHVICTKATDFLTPDNFESPHLSFNKIINDSQSLSFDASVATKDDIAVLQYTGGTTGVSKGAALTHANLLSNVEQMKERMGDKCVDGEEIFVCPLPLYHIYAFSVNALLFASLGNLNVLIPNPRDIDAFIGAIKPFKFSGFAGLNTLFVGLCSHPEFKKLDFSALKLTLSGGTTLTTNAANLWHEVTGCSISEGYGLSETSPVVAFNIPGKEDIGSIGQPLMETVVEFWDSNDEPVANGSEGQLVVKGPQVMQGYWNRPEETENAFKDGFFKTGDIALLKDNGNIKIVDRLKDMIIVSGFNVYPNEIEDVLTKHPDIFEAAVIGVADDKTGEKVSAFVSVHNAVNEDDVIAYCRELLTPYKVPKSITVLDELPKSTVGKILRRELR